MCIRDRSKAHRFPWYVRLFFWNQRRRYGSVLEPAKLWGRTPKVFAALATLYGALDRLSLIHILRIPGLKMTVVQADGVDVEAVSVDEFRFGPGETYDVIVEPKDEAYTIFAQSMDRSGYARGTLAVREGVSANVPEVDAPERLTMADMMGAMGTGMTSRAMGGMDHAAAGQMNHGAMAGMNHGEMAMDHSQHGMPTGGLATASQTVRHARTEYGPSTDMRVDMPRTNLDDPGAVSYTHLDVYKRQGGR